jgi:DNA-binding response OmpR family regulator
MKPKILVVDDEWSMRELLQHLLSLSGFDVVSAGDEDEFRKVLSSDKPDAIILDIMLGDTDGTELYKQLLKDGSLKNTIPVVFLSALASDRPPTLPRPDRQYALIGKPFDPDLLVRELRHALVAYEPQ